jgi:hypothetical protein
MFGEDKNKQTSNMLNILNHLQKNNALKKCAMFAEGFVPVFTFIYAFAIFIKKKTNQHLFSFFHSRQNGEIVHHHHVNHISPSNDNVSFGKRDYTQLEFSYLNDLDRSDAETTTEL